MIRSCGHLTKKPAAEKRQVFGASTSPSRITECGKLSPYPDLTYVRDLTFLLSYQHEIYRCLYISVWRARRFARRGGDGDGVSARQAGAAGFLLVAVFPFGERDDLLNAAGVVAAAGAVGSASTRGP